MITRIRLFYLLNNGYVYGLLKDEIFSPVLDAAGNESSYRYHYIICPPGSTFWQVSSIGTRKLHGQIDDNIIERISLAANGLDLPVTSLHRLYTAHSQEIDIGLDEAIRIVTTLNMALGSIRSYCVNGNTNNVNIYMRQG